MKLKLGYDEMVEIEVGGAIVTVHGGAMYSHTHNHRPWVQIDAKAGAGLVAEDNLDISMHGSVTDDFVRVDVLTPTEARERDEAKRD